MKLAELLLEYTAPVLWTGDFRRRKAGKDKYGNNLPIGICPVCGQHRDLAQYKNFPMMCYQCYIKLKIYRQLKFDVLSLQKKNKITLKDAIKIVKYVDTYYKKKKTVALLLIYNLLKSKK